LSRVSPQQEQRLIDVGRAIEIVAVGFSSMIQ
jgi:hypothetical protein